MNTPHPKPSCELPCNSWWQHRESSRNWLAFGLLLAAWNAVDNDAGQIAAAGRAQRRPETLRGYTYVTVRAATRDPAMNR